MPKKAIITAVLVDESRGKSNRDLETEIFSELSKYPSRIPWMKHVVKVEVVEY
ncbi:MAG: hypothetical protein QXZ25_06335 [Candidatus Bathyarchaeia archaeon]